MSNCEYSLRPGIIFIDKPEGITSSKVDVICKRVFKTRKIGHIGTLDPFASGILPIAINGATKLIPYFKWIHEKTYEFEIKFGEKTDTADKTGQIIHTSNVLPNIEDIKKTLPKFLGRITQIPPQYSAIKINGRNAYELARHGHNPDIKPREVEIKCLNLLEQTAPDVFKFSATVSTGTYIRSLAEDLAQALNSVGHAYSLRRMAVGRFFSCISLDTLLKRGAEIVRPIEEVLDDIPCVTISDDLAMIASLGRPIELVLEVTTNMICAFSPSGFIGLLTQDANKGMWHPKRLICAISKFYASC